MSVYINTETMQYPLSLDDIKLQFPNVSFPSINFTPPEPFAIFKFTEKPQIDFDRQYIEESSPQIIDGTWTQVWSVINHSDEHIAQVEQDKINFAIKDAEKKRASAYKEESDPIFFKWQRGEATKEEWLNKVAEIKQRHSED